MALRSDDEIESTFALTCQILDRLMDDARPRLEVAGLVITDRSNRSCYDRTGYPYCLWEFYFKRELEHGSEIALAAARLWFVEPVEDTKPRELIGTSIAEIYQTGKTSRVDDRSEERIAISGIESMDLASLVQQLIGHSYARLLSYGVALG